MGTEATALTKAYERVARFPRTHHYTIGQRMVNTFRGAGLCTYGARRQGCLRQCGGDAVEEGRQGRLPHRIEARQEEKRR